MVRYFALCCGVVCHLSFAVAVFVMAIALFGGMDLCPASRSLAGSALWDAMLVLQFPVLHSLLLSKRGRGALERFVPGEVGQRLVTTTFVIVASLQLIVLFGAWAPLGVFRWEPSGLVLEIWTGIYAAAWALLAVAMWNAGLGTQMGYLGWWSVWRGRSPRYGSFPQHGLYKVCRHPVYFAMVLVALTGPVWTADHLVVACVFSAYCIVGPWMKDRRYRARFGDEFERYQQSVPFFPLLNVFSKTP